MTRFSLGPPGIWSARWRADDLRLITAEEYAADFARFTELMAEADDAGWDVTAGTGPNHAVTADELDPDEKDLLREETPEQRFEPVWPLPEPKREGPAVKPLTSHRFDLAAPAQSSRIGVENILRVYDAASANEKDYWGKWYHEAQADVQMLAQHYGLPFETVAAIVAVLSPGNKWASNLGAADAFLSGAEKVASYPANIAKCEKILAAAPEDAGRFVTGPKVTVFFQSLLDPVSVENKLTLDGHAINIWRGDRRPLKGLPSPNKLEREQMLADYAQAARQRGVSTQAMQAVTWYVWKYADGGGERVAALVEQDENFERTANEPDLSHLLLPAGQTKQIGPERAGKAQPNGIVRFVSPLGSYRYVYYLNGQAVAGLQIMRNMRNEKRWTGQIANVFTHPDQRRQGYAAALLTRAQQDFDEIVHSRDLSTAGSSWASAMKNRQASDEKPFKPLTDSADAELTAPEGVSNDALVELVREHLDPKALKKKWRDAIEFGGAHPHTGHAYSATEALYHLLGGAKSDWVPHIVRHEGQHHWFLKNTGESGADAGCVLDVACGHFESAPNYADGSPRGFMTGSVPSARAYDLIRKVRRAKRRLDRDSRTERSDDANVLSEPTELAKAATLDDTIDRLGGRDLGARQRLENLAREWLQQGYDEVDVEALLTEEVKRRRREVAVARQPQRYPLGGTPAVPSISALEDQKARRQSPAATLSGVKQLGAVGSEQLIELLPGTAGYQTSCQLAKGTGWCTADSYSTSGYNGNVRPPNRVFYFIKGKRATSAYMFGTNDGLQEFERGSPDPTDSIEFPDEHTDAIIAHLSPTERAVIQQIQPRLLSKTAGMRVSLGALSKLAGSAPTNTQHTALLREGDVANTSIVIVVRAPKAIAQDWPMGREGHDASPPHLTVLYVGAEEDAEGETIPLAPAKVQALRAAVAEVARKVEPFDAQMKPGVAFFENDKGESIAHKAFAPDAQAALARLHQQLRAACEAIDIEPKHFRDDHGYRAHATLAYLTERKWDPELGKVPEGVWPIEALEIWGLAEDVVIPLTGTGDDGGGGGGGPSEDSVEMGEMEDQMLGIAASVDDELAKFTGYRTTLSNANSTVAVQATPAHVRRAVDFDLLQIAQYIVSNPRALLFAMESYPVIQKFWPKLRSKTLDLRDAQAILEHLGPELLDVLADHASGAGAARNRVSAGLVEHVDQLPGGPADERQPDEFAPDALDAGLTVELEHTENENVAREIAMDHLTEDAEYYEKLKQVEQHDKQAGAREDALGQKYLTEYERTRAKFEKMVAAGHSPTVNTGMHLNFEAQQLFYAGRDWANVVVRQRVIPNGRHKATEMAVRLFSVRYPKDGFAWFSKNQARLALLAEAVAWPERTLNNGAGSTGGDDSAGPIARVPLGTLPDANGNHLPTGQVFKLGPFNAHNVVGAQGKVLADTQAVVQKAVSVLGQAGVPGLDAMAYGELYLVGQIARSNWAAWYMPKSDEIYLRPLVRGSSVNESARHLVHEIAHRYWKKKMTLEQKKLWASYDGKLRHADESSDWKLPVGTVLKGTLVNRKVPVIGAWEPNGVRLDDEQGQPIGVMGFKQFIGLVRQWQQRERFPTAYATSDIEEHFCEAVSLAAFGMLAPEAQAALRAATIG